MTIDSSNKTELIFTKRSQTSGNVYENSTKMSFVNKVTMLMSRPGAENVQKDDVPWWMRYSARGLGIIGGFLCILMGMFNVLGLITINISSVIAGLWQMLTGFFLLACEAPCCCFFIDYVQVISDKMESRPYWIKAVLYIIFSIVPLILCITYFTTWFASAAVMGTGVIYGMMALGKKASLDDMRTSAATLEAGMSQPPNTTTYPKANLVSNEQPVSYTGAPSRH